MSTPPRPDALPNERAESPLRVDLIESLDALEAHADAWHALLEAAIPGRSLFYRLPMLRAMAPVHAPPQHAGGRRSPFFLLAWRGDTLVGGLPLVLEHKPLSRAGVRILRLWGGDGSSLGLEGDLPLMGDARAVLGAFDAALRDGLRHRYDLLVLGYLRGDAAAGAALRDAWPDATWTAEALTAHHIDLTAGFAAYRASRPASRLRELARRKRKLAEAHRLEHRIRSRLTPDELADVLRLHSERQQQLTSRGARREFLSHASGRLDALTAALAAAADADAARHHLLYADGTLAAFVLTLVDGDTVLTWPTAIDERFAAFGPGTLVFWEAVAHEFARGTTRRISLGAGTTTVKSLLGNVTDTPWQVRRPSAAGGLARLRVQAFEGLVRLRASVEARRAGASPRTGGGP